MCSGSEEGSYLRRIDSCITQLKAQGPCSTCNESKEEEEEEERSSAPDSPNWALKPFGASQDRRARNLLSLSKSALFGR